MGQFRALEALLGHGPMSQAELGGAIFCGSSSASLVIKILGERGLVARRVDASDRKKKVVRITAEGEELARKILPLQARLVRARMAALGEREQISLARLCEKLDVGNPLKFVRELTRLDGEAGLRGGLRVDAKQLMLKTQHGSGRFAGRVFGRLVPQNRFQVFGQTVLNLFLASYRVVVDQHAVSADIEWELLTAFREKDRRFVQSVGVT